MFHFFVKVCNSDTCLNGSMVFGLMVLSRWHKVHVCTLYIYVPKEKIKREEDDLCRHFLGEQVLLQCGIKPFYSFFYLILCAVKTRPNWHSW